MWPVVSKSVEICKTHNLVPIIITCILAFVGLQTFSELSKRDNIFNYINNELNTKQALYYELQSGHAGIYSKIAEELETTENLKSKNIKLDELLDKLKIHNSQRELINCIGQLKDANQKIALLILYGAENKKLLLTGFKSDVECRKQGGDSENNDSSTFFHPIEDSSTYFLSIVLILLASIQGAVINDIRRHFATSQDTGQGKELSDGYFGAFANGLGVGIVLVLVVSWGGWSFAAIEANVVSGSYLKGISLVVLIGFVAGLFYHDFYKYLKKKADGLADNKQASESNETNKG